jgi:hypothetical protein
MSDYWVKLPASFENDEKIEQAGSAFLTFMKLWIAATRNRSGGIISASHIRCNFKYVTHKRHIDKLIHLGLLVECEAGFKLYGWIEKETKSENNSRENEQQANKNVTEFDKNVTECNKSVTKVLQKCNKTVISDSPEQGVYTPLDKKVDKKVELKKEIYKEKSDQTENQVTQDYANANAFALETKEPSPPPSPPPQMNGLFEPEVAQTEKESTKKQEFEQLFEQFWKNYPRKVGKKKAKQAFKSAIARCSAPEITLKAAHYRDDPNREDAFTKHPSTWLNGDCWNDPPLPQKQGAQRASSLDRRNRGFEEMAQIIAEEEWQNQNRQNVVSLARFGKEADYDNIGMRQIAR